ncbi:hypothetical protein ACJMK2_043755 [Sinanodonta woodiana]|uniref:Uncharacterized protein n=1 Tax=Sinanodonta woodiana TaxID=1069815 RepID=A0ABD3VYP6_SINWO
MDSVTGRGSHAAAEAGVDSNSQGTSVLASDEKIRSDRIDGSARASRSFGKECTVVIDVKDVKKIKASHIIRCVEELAGDIEDIAQIHSLVDDVTRVIQHDAADIQDDADDIQHDADDKKEIENAKQQDESGKCREENDRNNVELTNEEIKSEEEGNNNQAISCRSVTDSGDDRMVVEDFVKITKIRIVMKTAQI